MTDVLNGAPATTVELPTKARDTAPPVRRVRGLRFPVLPTGGLIAQVAGGIAVTAGVYVQFGIAATLMVTGAATLVGGMLREAGRI